MKLRRLLHIITIILLLAAGSQLILSCGDNNSSYGSNVSPAGMTSAAPATGGPSDTADRYVKLMRSGNYEDAYAMLDSEWKEFFSSKAEFASAMREMEPEYARNGKASILFSLCDDVEVAAEKTQGSGATVDFSASCTLPGKGTSSGLQQVRLVSEGGVWKIRPGSEQ